MKVVFISNYINHHQIPFCDEMFRLLEGNFTFIQTQEMEAERVRMGWHGEERPAYVKCWYEEPGLCRKLVMECDAALFGETDDESYITRRLASGKMVVRISERLYKTGQWKAVSPRGLRKKYLDHTRYRNGKVYLLCAGAYVPSDFHIVRAYPGKMYCWGYFPETRRYDVEALLAGKGWEGPDGGKMPYLLWAGRMIEWKHPELAVETAAYLKEKNIPFHLDMVGDGQMRAEMEALRGSLGLGEEVRFLGFQPPEDVRGYMEKADIFLFTSDRQEGWGAVANEAMNSGCALVADHMIGAVPYLVNNGRNGFAYRDGNRRELFEKAAILAGDQTLCRRLGQNAYETIATAWNAEKAAGKLLALVERLAEEKEDAAVPKEGCFRGTLFPCDPAPVLTERSARRIAKKGAAPFAQEGQYERCSPDHGHCTRV